MHTNFNPRISTAAVLFINLSTQLTYAPFQMQPGFKQQTLAEVNEELIETWKDIRNMYTAPALQTCLDIYSANTGLVEWLKEATSGVFIFLMHKFCIC